MEPTNEEIVTKLLSCNEILHVKNSKALITKPIYDLGEFLDNVKHLSSPYGEKYIFIK